MWRLQDILIEITDFIFDQKRSGYWWLIHIILNKSEGEQVLWKIETQYLCIHQKNKPAMIFIFLYLSNIVR